MKSTVIPSPGVAGCLIGMCVTFAFGFLMARSDGFKKIDALKAQYAEEDKAAAESVEKLSKELKDQCQAEKEFIHIPWHFVVTF